VEASRAMIRLKTTRYNVLARRYEVYMNSSASRHTLELELELEPASVHKSRLRLLSAADLRFAKDTLLKIQGSERSLG
jgi:hypothetical protein